jgi:SMC interacting uncharacterized protein involved in chromosome segregation
MDKKEDINASQKDLEDLHRKFDDHYADRMDRIERKLNQLTDAVVSIARAEEKIAVLIEDTREIKDSLNQHVNRIQQLEVDVEQTKGGLSNLSKFLWIVVGALVAGVVTFGLGQLGV